MYGKKMSKNKMAKGMKNIKNPMPKTKMKKMGKRK
jgi:hypothetical protein